MLVKDKFVVAKAVSKITQATEADKVAADMTTIVAAHGKTLEFIEALIKAEVKAASELKR